MRDASMVASAVIALGATSGTPVAGADTIEFGTMNTAYRNASNSGLDGHQTGLGQDSLLAVFQNTVAMESIDCFYGLVYDCDTVGGTYVQVAVTPRSALGAAAGTRVTCHIPTKHRKFLKFYACGVSTGTLTTKNVWAWIEPGPNT